MAEHAIPTKANQPNVDLGQEISPDGNPVTQLAAPTHAPRTQQSSNSNATTMEAAPAVDEHGNEVTPEKPETQETHTETQQKETQTEEKVTDFTEFLKIKETGELSDDIQKAKLPEKEPTTEVQAKSEGEKTTPQQKQTLAERKAQDLQTRDLTGLPEDLVPHFQKDMSRAAFDKVKPIVLEHKTLKEQAAQKDAELERLRKGAIPESYYDNPHGYILDPEYLKAENTTAQAQAVLHHWQRQFKAVRDGAAEFEIAQFDRNGNLVSAGKMPAGKEAETQILEVVNNAQQQLFKVAGKAEAIRETFKQRHTNALGWLDNYEGKAFAHFNTEQGKQFEPQIKSIIAEFPPEFRNHPLAKTLAKSIATNVHLATLLVQNQGKGAPNGQAQASAATTKTLNGKPATVVEHQRRAGPTMADTGAASSASTGKEKGDVSFEDFQKAKEENY